MKTILVTGGTVFVSKYVAAYFARAGHKVYLLNRNRHPQPEGTILIEADRHHLGNILKSYEFDAVLDVTAYTGEDVSGLLDGLGAFRDYVLISSSAVYPETLPQPFLEEQQTGANKYWGIYGTNKIEAEKELLRRVPKAYILRPPYLYGPMNNVYREAFVFECADKGRRFYLPQKGEMRLQFFHVLDLCRCMQSIMDRHPGQYIFNVGNEDRISIREWAYLCYEAAGCVPEFVQAHKPVHQREYFCFYDYEYSMDVSGQKTLLESTISMKQGLKESYEWYCGHKDAVNRKGYIIYGRSDREW